MYPKSQVDLSVDFCGVKFENPFVLAAAPPTDELEMVRNGFKAGFAGAVLKTTSIESNPVPLKYPMMTAQNYECGRISALGNIDLISLHRIDKIEERIKKLKEEFPNKIVIPSIMGAQKEDWQTLVKRCGEAGADMIECSFSCPQGTLAENPKSETPALLVSPDASRSVPAGSRNPKSGWMLGQDPFLSARVVSWLKEVSKIPVVIKLTPHVTDFVEVAEAVKQAGADAVCVSNTFKALMGIDLETLIPNPNVEGKSTYSGMSGPAVRPMVLRLIAEVSRKAGIPVTASGGITTWTDAVEGILCGAKTVQVCTVVMHYGFEIVEDLIEGLSDYLEKRGLKSVSELVGWALPNIVAHDELSCGHKIISKINPDLCVRCGDCVIACRDGGHMAIKADSERFVVVDIEKCVGCGLCGLVCPVKDCISMIKK